ASGESCGGSFVNSFAESCNSVFAPLGAKVGPKRLVETAEKYGWNEQPSIPGAAMSSIPPADQVGDDLAVGSTAIGQGKVLATALQMASVGATIANNGVRAHPTLLRGQFPRVTRVTSRRVAHTIRGLMIEVVRSGTGVKAALPGVTVGLLMCSSSGRLESEDSLILNSSIDPCWTTPLPAALEPDGITWPCATGRGR